MATVSNKPFVFDDKAWAEKLSKLEAARNKAAGLPNHNPFLWMNANVKPLLDRYHKNERSEELFKAFLSLPETIPPLG